MQIYVWFQWNYISLRSLFWSQMAKNEVSVCDRGYFLREKPLYNISITVFGVRGTYPRKSYNQGVELGSGGQ